MKKKTTFLLLMMMSLCVFISCNDDDDGSGDYPTYRFPMIEASVRYESGGPVSLDSVIAYLDERALVLSSDYTDERWSVISQISGNYMVVDPTHLELFPESTSTLVIKGFRRNKVLFEEDVQVTRYLNGLKIEYNESSLRMTIGRNMYPITVKDEERICTEELATIPIKVQYVDGTPVALDSCVVFTSIWDKSAGNIFAIKDFGSEEYKTAQKTGVYPIADDRSQSILKGRTTPAVFSGYIKDKVVFSQTFEIGATECHVVYADEKEPVVMVYMPKEGQ